MIDSPSDTRATDGLVSASAHMIAARGDFNQALILYHFESIAALVALGRLVETIGDAIPDRLHPAATRYADKRARGGPS